MVNCEGDCLGTVGIRANRNRTRFTRMTSCKEPGCVYEIPLVDRIQAFFPLSKEARKRLKKESQNSLSGECSRRTKLNGIKLTHST